MNNYNIFKKKYTDIRNKRTFTPHNWFKPACSQLLNTITEDKKLHRKHSLWTLSAPTGSAKSMLMAVISMFLGFCKRTLIIVPKTAVRNQHRTVYQGLADQQWLNKIVKVINYQQFVSVTNKPAIKLNLEEKELINHIKESDVIFLDEPQEWTKGKEAKAIKTVVEQCLTINDKKQRVMIAISATVDNLLGWFSVMATYMNITEKFAQWGRRYTYTRLQAAKDNVIEFPEVRVSHVSTKTEIGQGKLPSHYDSKSIEEMSVTELEKTCTEQFAITKEDSNAEDHKKNLLNDQDTIKLDPNRLFAEIRTYVENRGKRAIINIQNENKPALVFAPRRVDADTFFENWNKTNTQNECVVWHGESDDFISSKGDSDAIQKRLQDLNDPLQVIVLVGMWKSGVDIDISRIHDLAYKHKNKDRKIQVVGRMRKGGVYHAYTDVLNIFEKYDSKLVDDLCKQMGITPEEVQVLLTAKDVNQDDDDPNDQIQAGKKTEENGDEDNENTRHLEKLFGLGEEPITVGWIKRVGNAESSDVITIPNDVFHSGGDNLSDRKKIDNFMREIESA